MPLRLSDKCLGVVKAVPGRGGTVFGVLEGVLEFPRVFRGVRVCTGDFWRCLVVFSFNLRHSQMESLTFSSRPGGPKCLKYQNVPKLQKF